MIPTTVFTPLEYGAIGLPEEDARKLYGDNDIEVYHSYFKPLEHNLSEREGTLVYLLCSSPSHSDMTCCMLPLPPLLPALPPYYSLVPHRQRVLRQAGGAQVRRSGGRLPLSGPQRRRGHAGLRCRYEVNPFPPLSSVFCCPHRSTACSFQRSLLADGCSEWARRSRTLT